MEKEFRNLLFNQTTNANDVIRYSGTYLVRQENLSSHIYEVSMLAYEIANILNNRYNEKLDIGVILEKSLIHDIDETATGDIVRNVKHHSEKTKESLDEVASLSVKSISDRIEGLESVYDVWSTAKDGKEGLLIKLVDMIVVARKASLEVEIYNNYGALKTVTELTYHLEVLLDEIQSFEDLSLNSMRYLVSLIKNVSDHISLLQNKYYDALSIYNVDKSVINVEDGE